MTAKAISIDHGVMNLISPCIGGIPVCHGAGGMAGHMRFGARTGGALVFLGIIVLLSGLFLSDSISLILQVFPHAVLGVILFFAGVELALVVKDVRMKKENLFVLLVTAGTAMWNMGWPIWQGCFCTMASSGDGSRYDAPVTNAQGPILHVSETQSYR